MSWVIVNFVTSSSEEIFYVSDQEEKKTNKFILAETLKYVFPVFHIIVTIGKYL